MLNMQNVKDIEITEGDVRTIHDKNNKLIWGRLAYDTKYDGNTIQNGTPTPTAPINVNVVTGTQTVTISDGVDSEDYTISLGTIELCKIGTYQDYIYKSGDDWYVHKETERVILNGSETWNKANVSFQTVAATTQGVVLEANMSGYSNYFVQHYYTSGISSNIQNGEFGWSSSRILTMRNDDCADANAFKTWLGTHNTSVYYQLANPTDTQITDTNLITQLNNIHQFLTRYGYNSNVTGNLPIIINQTSL